MLKELPLGQLPLFHNLKSVVTSRSLADSECCSAEESDGSELQGSAASSDLAKENPPPSFVRSSDVNPRQFVFNGVPGVCVGRNQFHLCGDWDSPGLAKEQEASMLEMLPSGEDGTQVMLVRPSGETQL